MCSWGATVMVRCKIDADLSCEGKDVWRDLEIDSCIAPIVRALQVGGIDMRGSCCGHGRGDGSILLLDGRELIVRKAP